MFFYYKTNLHGTISVILAHVALSTSFIIILVTASLAGISRTTIRAAHCFGANWMTTLSKFIFPLILPGVISGALFAFITSFFVHHFLSRQF